MALSNFSKKIFSEKQYNLNDVTIATSSLIAPNKGILEEKINIQTLNELHTSRLYLLEAQRNRKAANLAIRSTVGILTLGLGIQDGFQLSDLVASLFTQQMSGLIHETLTQEYIKDLENIELELLKNSNSYLYQKIYEDSKPEERCLVIVQDKDTDRLSTKFAIRFSNQKIVLLEKISKSSIFEQLSFLREKIENFDNLFCISELGFSMKGLKKIGNLCKINTDQKDILPVEIWENSAGKYLTIIPYPIPSGSAY